MRTANPGVRVAWDDPASPFDGADVDVLTTSNQAEDGDITIFENISVTLTGDQTLTLVAQDDIIFDGTRTIADASGNQFTLDLQFGQSDAADDASILDLNGANLTGVDVITIDGGSDASDLDCFADGLLGTSTDDDDLAAFPGQVRYYVTTAINCAGESVLGSDRTPGLACP